MMERPTNNKIGNIFKALRLLVCKRILTSWGGGGVTPYLTVN
jgi:hypothetical protein